MALMLLLSSLLFSSSLALVAPWAGCAGGRISSRSPYPRASLPVRRARGLKRSERTIFVDGNNLMMQRKVTKGREALAQRLAGIRGADVIVVFDGRAGESYCDSGRDPRVVVTEGGAEDGSRSRESADEWIIAQLQGEMKPSRDAEVSIVTADRLLRKEAQRVSAKTINPVKFWSRYLPRLKGLKSDYSNEPNDAD